MMTADAIRIESIAHHHNGVGGEPFHVILFDHSDDEGPIIRKVAIVTKSRGGCFVLAVGQLAAGDIAFGSNSWRGDVFEDYLREAIARWEESRRSLPRTP